MAQLSGETVKNLAREIFDYEITDHDARSVASVAGAMLTLSPSARRQRFALRSGPAFGFANLNAEAARLNAKMV